MTTKGDLALEHHKPLDEPSVGELDRSREDG